MGISFAPPTLAPQTEKETTQQPGQQLLPRPPPGQELRSGQDLASKHFFFNVTTV